MITREQFTILAGAILLACALLIPNMPADDIADRAHKSHFASIVLDTHDDTPQRMLFEHFDLGHRDSEGQIDIPRMRDGGLNAIFFSIWAPVNITGPAAKRAMDLISAVRDQTKFHNPPQSPGGI